MLSSGALLRANQGQSGTFVKWLEDLGLKDFLKSYPLKELVEWRWLVPKSRVHFPREFFLAWKHFPTTGNDDFSGFETQSILWDSYWHVDESEPLWFLDGFFHPDDEPGKILDEGAKKTCTRLPEEFFHPNGHVISPYVDYFFHWQGYALIDVIRAADCIAPVINTPDAQSRVKNLAVIIESIRNWKPEAVLTLPNRWGGLAEPMTWLSHYRAFRDAIHGSNSSRFELQRKGAKRLAAHLGISSEALVSVIKNKLLVLARDWIDANNNYCVWTIRAYPHLQRDISIAVEWLCYLTDKTFSDYLDAWQNELSPLQSRSARLHDVLEFEFFSDKKHFQTIAPEYLKDYNAIFHSDEPLEDTRLMQIINKLHSDIYPFGSFLGAFRQLHEELSYKFNANGALDFRELRPLDHFSLLAIRAEGCLRFSLEQSNLLGQLGSLKEYVEYLAKRKSISSAALDQYSKYLKSKTKLHATPDDPIGALINLNTGLSDKEHYLVQAFLCCELARNYFAHRHYLDQKLIRSKEGGFMLSGILVTVLYLLGDS